MKKLVILVIIFRFFIVSSQETGYFDQPHNSDTSEAEIYRINDTLSYLYRKPKPFSYIRHSLEDLYLTPKVLVQKENIIPILGVTASSLLLIAFDEEITEAAQQFGRFIHLSPENNAKNISPIDGLRFYVPTDLSSGLYYIGDGITEVAVDAGFYIYSIFTKDIRARQTSVQLTEGMIVTGIFVQLLKHMTGRITARKGDNKDLWRWFPSIREYHSDVPGYDAFPSGHLAIAMATTTIIALNYPEKKYIKPLGYSLMALCGYQMLNNGVHWAGDYPLAIAMGYTIGKIAVNRGRMQMKTAPEFHDKPEYSLKPAYLGHGVTGLKFSVRF